VIVNASRAVTFDGFTAQAGAGSPYDMGFQSVAGYCLTNSANTTGGALRSVTVGGSTSGC
jgi:hypothetical protein